MNDAAKELRAVKVEHFFDSLSNENCPKAMWDGKGECDCDADGQNATIQRAADDIERLIEALRDIRRAAKEDDLDEADMIARYALGRDDEYHHEDDPDGDPNA